MNAPKRRMLHRLQRLLPEGLIADAAWFSRMGYSTALRARYLEGGWLERLARGVFRRPLYRPGLGGAAPLIWQHVVVSLQAVMEHPVAVGGRTALELAGLAHYASRRGLREVHLYGDRPAPGWLGGLPIEANFVFHNARRLFPTSRSPMPPKLSRQSSVEGGPLRRHRSTRASTGTSSATAVGRLSSPHRNGRFWSSWTRFRRERPSIRPTC